MNDIKQDLIELKQEVPYYAENFIKKIYMLFGDKKTARALTALNMYNLVALNDYFLVSDAEKDIIEDNIIADLFSVSKHNKSAEEASKLTEVIMKSKEQKDG